jgi:hypothetical protein
LIDGNRWIGWLATVVFYGLNKRVPYTQIKGLQCIEIKGLCSGRWRFWGTGNARQMKGPFI